MMDYFRLRQDDRFTDVPVLRDIRQQLDTRDICPKRAHHIADSMMFYVEAGKDTFYPDVLDQQLFLVSERLKPLIEIYAPDTIFKDVPLVDLKQERQSNYYLPIFEELEALGPGTEYYRDQQTVKEPVLQYERLGSKRIFRVKESEKPFIVVRLDAAESMLRRDFTGLKLERLVVV
ncbi:hypothetical protein [Paenibacillus sp. MMS18-CY102]|uniref:hypothetical protein n=1 Tax=Paenibacillus sp. MMS18-CY102 TaxID=2682849 RepID=UPI0013664751|nr:hypothetical protein [Paenibacillus sp. MMS18-CY102]MWC31267.1 hypothetical protein [Paenibacillus sp. MMS18-CY102]